MSYEHFLVTWGRKFTAVTGKFGVIGLLLAAGLAGCGEKDAPPRKAFLSTSAAAGEASLNGKGQVVSPMLDALWARRSILAKPSTFSQISDAALEASRASAEAQLRVKRLTAKARSRNWLPKLGPDVSLTSLTSIAASLVMDQSLFDRGKRQAERDHAAADVEIAAIGLVDDLNRRVYDALRAYIEAERAAELAQITQNGIVKLQDFERITALRREGGLSDGAELQVVAQRRAEAEASLLTWRNGEAKARLELQNLTAGRLPSLSGLSPVQVNAPAQTPLAVLHAQAEAARQSAEIRMTRSGFLPGLGAGARVGEDGNLDGALSLQGDMLGFGRADQLDALAASTEVSARKLAEVERESTQKLDLIAQEIRNLEGRVQVDGAVIKRFGANMGLYTDQYKAGRRSVVDLTGQYETLVNMQIEYASLKYQIALLRLEQAVICGTLVDGKVM